MKKAASFIVLLIVVLCIIPAVAQQNVGIGTATPDPSALLELSSQSHGILVPRMTSAQRIAIVSPARGLLVYDTNFDQFWYFDGTVWVQAIGPMGPAGPTGAQGIQGIQGLQGLTGPTGAQGIQGIQGLTGPTGAQGIQGIQGLQGLTGPTGAQGIQGIQGLQGIQGIQGIPGTAGLTGPTGNVGAQGVTGPTGADGAANAWALLGNSGTVDGINFLGTTNNVALNFRVNNQKAGRLSSTGQVFMGYQAGNSNTSSLSIGIGFQALFTNSTGNNNIAIGNVAAYDNTIGYQNVAIGSEALTNNIGGYNNIAIGERALFNNTSGNNNIAIGYWALQGDANGINNTGVGRYVLYQNQGDYNTGCGYAAGAGASSPTYTYCTFLGYDADASSSGTYSNAMALGNASSFTATNYVRIGNTSVTQIGGQVGWSTLSDARIKEQVTENVAGLDFIMKLRPVTYHFNKNKTDAIVGREDKSEYPEKYDIEKIQFSGFIAQEVEAAAKSSNYDFSGVNTPKNDKDLYSLKYAEFVVPIVKAIQEQQQLILELKQQNETLKKEVDALKKQQ